MAIKALQNRWGLEPFLAALESLTMPQPKVLATQPVADSSGFVNKKTDEKIVTAAPLPAAIALKSALQAPSDFYNDLLDQMLKNAHQTYSFHGRSHMNSQ